MKTTMTKKAENRKARFNYELIEEFCAGMVLTGCEIKSIRASEVNMGESFCYINNGEVFVKNMHISVYDHSGYSKEDPLRERKLLLNKKEIRKLKEKTSEKGMTIVPLSIFLDENGRAKMKIALAKGKHTYDKKQTIKERDLDRQMRKEY